MAKRRYVGVYNITSTSRITCVYREQWYVIITFDHSYYKNSYVTWAPGILSRHLVNGCVLKCSCIGLMGFRNLSCLGIIICYINIIGIIPAYACNVLDVCDAFVQILQPLANVHETKWTRHVKTRL